MTGRVRLGASPSCGEEGLVGGSLSRLLLVGHLSVRAEERLSDEVQRWIQRSQTNRNPYPTEKDGPEEHCSQFDDCLFVPHISKSLSLIEETQNRSVDPILM